MSTKNALKTRIGYWATGKCGKVKLILKLFPVLPINIEGNIGQIHGGDSQKPIIGIKCDSHSRDHRFYVRGNVAAYFLSFGSGILYGGVK